MTDILLLALGVALAEPGSPPRLAAVTCVRQGEEQSTRTRICYYDCNGTRVAITIDRHRLCPLTIVW